MSGHEFPQEAQRLYRAASAAFPEIVWSWEEFEQQWPPYHAESSTRPADEHDFVRAACLEGKPGAARVLEQKYLLPLRPVVARICHSEDVTDLAMQSLREKLLMPPAQRLRHYRSTGSFKAWLRVVATRTALDVARRHRLDLHKQLGLEEQLLDLAPDPEHCALREEWRSTLRESLRSAIKRLPDEQRRALRMHLVLDWSVSQIGSALSVHRATAARWLICAKERLQDLLREELTSRRNTLPPDAGDALLDAPSRLDVSLTHLFATTGIPAQLAADERE